MKRFLLFLLAAMVFLGSAVPAWAADDYSIPVNRNTRIDIQIVDADGRAVAPGAIRDISYIVKSCPEGAKVSVSTADSSKLEETGKLTFAVCCDKPGTVEIQSFISTRNIITYYTGVHTIQVQPEKSADSKTVILSIGSRQLIVGNEVVNTDVAPLIYGGRTFVPLRVLSDIYGADCSYNAATGEVTVTKGDTSICMTIGADTYSVNGAVHTMDAPAYIQDGRTMVPIRFIADAFSSVVKLTYNTSGAVADILLQL